MKTKDDDDNLFGRYMNDDYIKRYSDSGSEDEEDSEQIQKQQHNHSKGSLKRNAKSKNYINKISQIQKQDRRQDQESVKIQQKDEVLKRNRKSAKQCRQRKKIYINLLEMKVEELKTQINTTKANLKNEYKMLTKITEELDPHKIKYIMNKLDLERKIADERNSNKTDFGLLLDSYLYKYDINGKFKSGELESQFQQIIRLLFDHKLVTFWEKNILSLDNSCFDMLTICNQTNHNYGKVAALIQNHREKLFNIVMKLKQIKQEIQNRGNRLQYLTEELARHIGQAEILQFLIHPLYTPEKKLDLGLTPNDSVTSLDTLKKKVKM